MKKLPILLILFIVGNAFASNTSRITNVTVYQKGARITSEVILDLKAGNNEVVVTDLTSSINANSVQVKLNGAAILLSATTRVRQKENAELPFRTKSLNDSLLLLINEIKWLQSEKIVYEGERDMIIANQKLNTSEEKASVEEIIRMSDFYRSRLLEISKKTHSIDREVHTLNLEKKKVEEKLRTLSFQERKNVGEVVLKISANTTSKIKAQVIYTTQQAGWSPIYDIRALGANKPIELIYKANVYQSTGYAWKNVNLSISTGNPSVNNNRPTMYPWHLNFQEPVYYSMPADIQMKSAPMLSNSYQRSMVVEEDKEYAEEEIMFEVVETENTIATEYSIQIAQDIPSDGHRHLVAIQEHELSAKFSHHAIPKLNNSTFLIAKVADYGNYNLLAGQANLFFDGMYIGQTYINPNTTTDSLLLSLGRDEKVIIKRNQLSDLTSQQVIGSNKKETRAYEITLRNNNKYAVNIDLMDQIPLSNNKDIVVEIIDANGARIDADYGSLLWKVNLKANESRTVRFSYSVKYPKDKTIANI